MTTGGRTAGTDTDDSEFVCIAVARRTGAQPRLGAVFYLFSVQIRDKFWFGSARRNSHSELTEGPGSYRAVRIRVQAQGLAFGAPPVPLSGARPRSHDEVQ